MLKELLAFEMKLAIGRKVYAVGPEGRLPETPAGGGELVDPRSLRLENEFGDAVAYHGASVRIQNEGILQHLMAGPNSFVGGLFRQNGHLLLVGAFEEPLHVRLFLLIWVNFMLLIAAGSLLLLLGSVMKFITLYPMGNARVMFRMIALVIGTPVMLMAVPRTALAIVGLVRYPWRAKMFEKIAAALRRAPELAAA